VRKSFVDTSVVLRLLFNEPESLQSLQFGENTFASELLSVEVRRAFDRIRLSGRINDALLAKFHVELSHIERGYNEIKLSSAILKRASMPMSTTTKTLDAIHIASALVLRERGEPNVDFVTHDIKQARAAQSLGFNVVGI